jgi:hypothetical protein
MYKESDKNVNFTTYAGEKIRIGGIYKCIYWHMVPTLHSTYNSNAGWNYPSAPYTTDKETSFCGYVEVLDYNEQENALKLAFMTMEKCSFVFREFMWDLDGGIDVFPSSRLEVLCETSIEDVIQWS